MLNNNHSQNIQPQEQTRQSERVSVQETLEQKQADLVHFADNKYFIFFNGIAASSHECNESHTRKHHKHNYCLFFILC